MNTLIAYMRSWRDSRGRSDYAFPSATNGAVPKAFAEDANGREHSDESGQFVPKPEVPEQKVPELRYDPSLIRHPEALAEQGLLNRNSGAQRTAGSYESAMRIGLAGAAATRHQWERQQNKTGSATGNIGPMQTRRRPTDNFPATTYNVPHGGHEPSIESPYKFPINMPSMVKLLSVAKARLAKRGVSFQPGTPPGIMADKLDDLGDDEMATALRLGGQTTPYARGGQSLYAQDAAGNFHGPDGKFVSPGDVLGEHTHTGRVNGGPYRTIDVNRLISLVRKRVPSKVKIDGLSGVSRAKSSGFSKKRIAGTDTRYPLLVDAKTNELIDGRHRAIKLLDSGKRTALAHLLSQADMRKATISGYAREEPLREAMGEGTYTDEREGRLRTIDVAKLFRMVKNRKAQRLSIADLERPDRSEASGFSKARVKTADTSKPILVERFSKVVLDGRHRLEKLRSEGRKTVMAHVVGDEEAEKARMYARDASGREHAPAGNQHGGEFVAQDGGILDAVEKHASHSADAILGSAVGAGVATAAWAAWGAASRGVSAAIKLFRNKSYAPGSFGAGVVDTSSLSMRVPQPTYSGLNAYGKAGVGAAAALAALGVGYWLATRGDRSDHARDVERSDYFDPNDVRNGLIGAGVGAAAGAAIGHRRGRTGAGTLVGGAAGGLAGFGGSIAANLLSRNSAPAPKSYGKDSQGREHAPAGSPEGGQFVASAEADRASEAAAAASNDTRGAWKTHGRGYALSSHQAAAQAHKEASVKHRGAAEWHRRQGNAGQSQRHSFAALAHDRAAYRHEKQGTRQTVGYKAHRMLYSAAGLAAGLLAAHAGRRFVESGFSPSATASALADDARWGYGLARQAVGFSRDTTCNVAGRSDYEKDAQGNEHGPDGRFTGENGAAKPGEKTGEEKGKTGEKGSVAGKVAKYAGAALAVSGVLALAERGSPTDDKTWAGDFLRANRKAWSDAYDWAAYHARNLKGTVDIVRSPKRPRLKFGFQEKVGRATHNAVWGGLRSIGDFIKGKKGMVAMSREQPTLYAKDAGGREHRGKGKGGGQFVAKSGSGEKEKPASRKQESPISVMSKTAAGAAIAGAYIYLVMRAFRAILGNAAQYQPLGHEGPGHDYLMHRHEQARRQQEELSRRPVLPDEIGLAPAPEPGQWTDRFNRPRGGLIERGRQPAAPAATPVVVSDKLPWEDESGGVKPTHAWMKSTKDAENMCRAAASFLQYKRDEHGRLHAPAGDEHGGEFVKEDRPDDARPEWRKRKHTHWKDSAAVGKGARTSRGQFAPGGANTPNKGGLQSQTSYSAWRSKAAIMGLTALAAGAVGVTAHKIKHPDQNPITGFGNFLWKAGENAVLWGDRLLGSPSALNPKPEEKKPEPADEGPPTRELAEAARRKINEASERTSWKSKTEAEKVLKRAIAAGVIPADPLAEQSKKEPPVVEFEPHELSPAQAPKKGDDSPTYGLAGGASEPSKPAGMSWVARLIKSAREGASRRSRREAEERARGQGGVQGGGTPKGPKREGGDFVPHVRAEVYSDHLAAGASHVEAMMYADRAEFIAMHGHRSPAP